MLLSRLLVVHALLTGAAGVVLIGAPALIPQAVDLPLPPGAYLLCYLLGAAELALAYLSYAGRRLTDAPARRLLCYTLCFFHGATAGVELLALYQGSSPTLWANVALRVAAAATFVWLAPAAPPREN
jgi:hypothetical protein